VLDGVLEFDVEKSVVEMESITVQSKGDAASILFEKSEPLAPLIIKSTAIKSAVVARLAFIYILSKYRRY
jgi:hypothetical protein